jgi:hypothetical protein
LKDVRHRTVVARNTTVAARSKFVTSSLAIPQTYERPAMTRSTALAIAIDLLRSRLQGLSGGTQERGDTLNAIAKLREMLDDDTWAEDGDERCDILTGN